MIEEQNGNGRLGHDVYREFKIYRKSSSYWDNLISRVPLKESAYATG
jgi:hypothetical protein